MAYNKWTEERLDSLRRIADSGVTMTSAAIEFGVTVQRISQLAAEHGIPFKTQGNRIIEAAESEWRARWADLIEPMKARVRADVEAMLDETTLT